MAKRGKRYKAVNVAYDPVYGRLDLDFMNVFMLMLVHRNTRLPYDITDAEQEIMEQLCYAQLRGDTDTGEELERYLEQQQQEDMTRYMSETKKE